MPTIPALGCLFLLGLWLIGYVGMSVAPQKEERPQIAPAAPSLPALHKGDVAVLELPGGNGVWLAIDDESYESMLDAENRKDSAEMDTLMGDGKVIREPNGTSVKVIGTSAFSLKVRILGGLRQGSEVWVQREFVRRP
jgi:hypothetical protein